MGKNYLSNMMTLIIWSLEERLIHCFNAFCAFAPFCSHTLVPSVLALLRSHALEVSHPCSLVLAHAHALASSYYYILLLLHSHALILLHPHTLTLVMLLHSHTLMHALVLSHFSLLYPHTFMPKHPCTFAPLYPCTLLSLHSHSHILALSLPCTLALLYSEVVGKPYLYSSTYA